MLPIGRQFLINIFISQIMTQLHKDVTSHFVTEYLEEVFVGEGKRIKLGLAQIPYFTEDNIGNIKRVHGAIEVW